MTYITHEKALSIILEVANNNNNNGNFIKCFSLHTYTIVNLSHKGNLRLAI